MTLNPPGSSDIGAGRSHCHGLAATRSNGRSECWRGAETALKRSAAGTGTQGAGIIGALRLTWVTDHLAAIVTVVGVAPFQRWALFLISADLTS
jgi:hypothetical protein